MIEGDTTKKSYYTSNPTCCGRLMKSAYIRVKNVPQRVAFFCEVCHYFEVIDE